MSKEDAMNRPFLWRSSVMRHCPLPHFSTAQGDPLSAARRYVDAVNRGDVTKSSRSSPDDLRGARPDLYASVCRRSGAVGAV